MHPLLRRLWRDYERHILVATILLLVCTNLASFASGVIAHDRIVALGGALVNHNKHVAPNRTYVLKGAGAASWSLASLMPEVGNQGDTLSCGAWAATEAAYAELVHRGEIPPDLSPWHTYWYATYGANAPTSFDQEAQALGGHGAVPQAAYPAFAALPAGLSPRARGWTYEYLFYQPAGLAGDSAIRGAIVAGHPVVLLMQVNGELLGDFGGQAITDNAGAFQFNHFVVAYAYDAAGIWIQNSWGSRFGIGGRIELSYRAVETSVLAAGILHPGAVGWPAPVPTATATPHPTMTWTPTATRTAVATPRPTATRSSAHSVFVVVHTQAPRALPRADSHRSPLVRVGTRLHYAGRQTPHWVRLSPGWLLGSNVRCLQTCRRLR